MLRIAISPRLQPFLVFGTRAAWRPVAGALAVYAATASGPWAITGAYILACLALCAEGDAHLLALDGGGAGGAVAFAVVAAVRDAVADRAKGLRPHLLVLLCMNLSERVKPHVKGAGARLLAALAAYADGLGMPITLHSVADKREYYAKRGYRPPPPHFSMMAAPTSDATVFWLVRPPVVAAAAAAAVDPLAAFDAAAVAAGAGACGAHWLHRAPRLDTFSPQLDARQRALEAAMGAG